MATLQRETKEEEDVASNTSSLHSSLIMQLSILVLSIGPAVLAAVVYLNSLSGDLVHDDVFAIRDNQDLKPSTPWSHLLLNDFWGESMASPTSHKSYRPITVLSFRLNYLWHGLEPWGYHLVNVLLHSVNTVLLGWFCMREVFVCPRRSYGFAEHGWSVVVMLLFASHPVHTEAVSKNMKELQYREGRREVVDLVGKVWSLTY